MPNKPRATVASRIVGAIVADILDRRGLGTEWKHTPFDVRQEIAEKWATLIREGSPKQIREEASREARVHALAEAASTLLVEWDRDAEYVPPQSPEFNHPIERLRAALAGLNESMGGISDELEERQATSEELAPLRRRSREQGMARSVGEETKEKER